jgi:outer membrane protein assembly factor BamB
MNSIVLVLGFCCFSSFAAHSWPQFRGPNASGVASDAKPPATFGPTNNVLWKTDLPYAPSSPCVWGDHIFVTTYDAGKLQVRDYRRSDGENLWARGFSVPVLEEFHAQEGSPAASTPATDGQRVVSYFGSFGLVCQDFEGNELWRQPMPPAQTAGGFGSGTSPIIVDGKVILVRDQNGNSAVMAYDIATGKKVWYTSRPDAVTGYSTPVVWKKNDRVEIIVAGSLQMKGYDAKDGSERWSLRGLPSYNVPSPVVTDDMIYFAGWSPGKTDSPWPNWASMLDRFDKNKDGKISHDEFGAESAWFRSQDVDNDGFITEKDWDAINGLIAKGQNALLAVKPGGAGDVTESNVAWRFEKGLPYVPSALYYDGRVYIIKDGGLMSSFEAKTGKPFYTQERINANGDYQASPVAADGRIFVASKTGKVSVIQAGGDKPKILNQIDFHERITATLAPVEDKIYLRTQTKLYAFGPSPQK